MGASLLRTGLLFALLTAIMRHDRHRNSHDQTPHA